MTTPADAARERRDPTARAVRYGRQILVHGHEAQAAIERSVAPVGGEGRARAWASLYATRAGFASIARAEIDRDALAPGELLASDAARDLLAASRAVLASMRRAANAESAPEDA